MKTLLAIFLLCGALVSAAPLALYVKSQGCEDPGIPAGTCGRAIIKVNGVDHCKHGRGHNVVVVNYETGAVESSVFFDTHANFREGERLRDHLNRIRDRRIVLIAIQDEGNRASAAHSAMIAVGAKAPISSGYRGSYALIGYKGKEEVDFVAQKKANRRRGPSVLSATVNTMPPTGSLDVQLRSEGCNDPNKQGPNCGWAFIKVNGVDRSLHRRGHNVVVLDAKTGRFLEARAYDTHGDRTAGNRLRDYLKTKTRDLIMLVAIQDEGSLQSRPAFAELRRLGARDPISNSYRGSYALVGYAGSPRPSWVKQEQRNSGKGPSVITVKIPIGGGGGGGTSPPPPPSGPCGVSSASRVIGGTDAKPGAWPWQVGLHTSSGRFFCGGSLIAPDWVVTAAHCVARSTNPSNYMIRLGDHNRNANEGTEQNIPAKRVIYHSSYNKPTPINNDIALIQLARPATLNSRIGTVCLPAHGYDVPTNSECYITGWGKIRHPGGSHHTLQQARMPPVTNSVCAKKLAASPGGSSLKITAQMVCAGIEGTIKSGCHGDSGGPYVCRNSAGRFVLQGAVSWGSPRCSAAERYTVFARVAQFRNWINQHTGGIPTPPPPRPPTPPPPPPPTTQAPPPPPPGSCGIRPNTRIVGGVAAKHGDWPWQAMLRTSSGFPYCGGTLVAPQWIVTATHCVRGKAPSSVFVRLGAHKRTSNVGTEQDFKVVKVVTHPSYHRPMSYSHDIALLKLERPALLNRHVNLACLPHSLPAPTDGDRCWITGWGRLASGGATPNILQQVSVPVVSQARCNKAYPNKIHDSMICAGLDKGGIDSCQGDSGGPMVCESGGRYYLQGATSWGYGCASPGKFGVYARVKYVMSWLNAEMKKP